jgi:hypothetical protein
MTKRSGRAGQPSPTARHARQRLRKTKIGAIFMIQRRPRNVGASQARGGQGNRAPSLLIDAPEFIAETVSDMRPPYQDTINQGTPRRA